MREKDIYASIRIVNHKVYFLDYFGNNTHKLCKFNTFLLFKKRRSMQWNLFQPE